MKIAAFLGDGIGPEVTRAGLDVLAVVNDGFHLGLEVNEYPCGQSARFEHETTFPVSSAIAAREAAGIILGPLSTSEYPKYGNQGVNASAQLRHDLDLYANIRPSYGIAGIDAVCPQMDLVIVRENTEGFYAVRTMYAGSGEFAADPDTVFAMRKISAKASRRIAERAFAIAATRRGRVTAVHKSNVLKLTDGLFLRECRAVAKQNPSIVYDEELVDAVATKLIRDRGDYDVLVTTNLFGDILSNQAAELAGGLGLAGSLNHGDSHAMAQASHGSAPDIAGKDAANPSSMILSVALLLRHLGLAHNRPALTDAGAAIEGALTRCLATPATRTRDVGGEIGTVAATRAVIDRLRIPATA